MNVYGIIAEFNPFHNGHKYLLDKAKASPESAAVVVMSGNFTQRGEPAILEKHQRAKAAILCGADLVIELPVAFAVSGAQTFARGGTQALSSLGLVDTLLFGSESGDTSRLSKTAKILNDKQVRDEISELAKTGVTFAAAREGAVRKIYGGSCADVLKNPNDNLAVEYICALNALRSKIKPEAVRRNGVSHNALQSDGCFASASFIRDKIRNGFSAEGLLPSASYEILKADLKNGSAPADYGKLDIAVLAFLRKAAREDFVNVPDVSEGIENRILGGARNARTLNEAFDNAKTKRYTHARIRRIVLCAFLGIRKTDASSGMPYLRVLGFSQKGREILHEAKKTVSLPIVMRACDIQSLDEKAKRAFYLESTATDIYNLTLPEIRPCGTEMTENPVII